jgi:hypothetical protein
VERRAEHCNVRVIAAAAGQHLLESGCRLRQNVDEAEKKEGRERFSKARDTLYDLLSGYASDTGGDWAQTTGAAHRKRG